MTIHNMKSSTFKKATFEQWKEEALHSLKGAPFDKLITKTFEGIDLQPLYTEDDLNKRANNKELQALSSIRVSQQTSNWIIAQQQYAKDGKQFVEQLHHSLNQGNEAIVYDGSIEIEWDPQSINEISKLVTTYPIFIRNTNNNDSFLNAFKLVPQNERHLVKGAISVEDWTLPSGFSNVRTMAADLWKIHHDGADAVTELALVLAQAAQFATSFNNFKEFADKFFVRFAVDTHFFMEIAKTRALRILWQSFAKAYGESDISPIPVIATTSLRSYSKLDPYVNLLRAGNEAFSAVLGGADVVTVHPHDVLTGPTPVSMRLARNVQLVIKAETLVDKIIDPSGGSYFIEALSIDLAQHAWNLFLSIEKQGGYNDFVSNGKLKSIVEQCQVERNTAVAEGEKSLIGTNVYAELTESFNSTEYGMTIERRPAEAFEEIREHFNKLQPRAVLLTFGELAKFKPRADFVSGYLATGGIVTEWSPPFTDVNEAKTWLVQEKPNYAIVCAAPEITETIMNELLQQLPNQLVLDVAGKYERDLSQQWLNTGLNGFIFSGQNRIEKLKEIRQRLKGGLLNEEA